MKARKLNCRLLVKLMIPLALLLGLVAWQLAFKKTWEAYRKYSALSDTEDPAGTLSALSISPAYSASRKKVVDVLYERYRVDTLNWKNQLWNHCAVLSGKYGCSVQTFPAWKPLNYNSTTLLRQEVVFAGNYAGLLRLQQALDTLKGIGLLAGLSYIRNEREQQTSLKLQLLGLPVTKMKDDEQDF